jgi:hypothetical protein
MTRTAILGRPRTYWALGGPLLLGALPGLRYGLAATLWLGPSLLVATVATVAVMGPALYLLWGLTGAQGSLAQVRGAFAEALTAAGRVQVGFAPAVLLLAATVAYADHAVMFALAAFAGGLLVGTVRLWKALRRGASRGHVAAVLGPWLLASMVLGGRLVEVLVGKVV